MDYKKSGIRVMHLETQKQNRSDYSPTGRRRIFPQCMPQPEKTLKILSPIKNEKSPQNSFHQMEFQNLVNTLKKKSLQLERKNEIISRMRKQIDNLKTENEKCQLQIQRLKKQSSKSYTSSHINSPPLNEPYEQFNMPGQRTRLKYMNFNQKPEPRHSFIEGSKHEQDQQTISNIVSPLMALSSPMKPDRSNEFKSRVSEKEYHAKNFNIYNQDVRNMKYRNEGFVEREKKKEFEIDDSRQFRFEDVDFSDLDQSQSNHQIF